MNEVEYKKLKARVEAARATRDRAAGQLDGVMARLLKDFGCSTIEQAEKLVNKLEREAAVAEREFDDAAEKFQKEFDEHFAE